MEPSAELPQLPPGDPPLPAELPPELPPEQDVPDQPQPLPENAPSPAENANPSPEPLPAAQTPLEEAPAPPDSLVSFFQGSDTPTTDDMSSDEFVHGPQLDPNAVSYTHLTLPTIYSV